jgi:uncharacterized protein
MTRPKCCRRIDCMPDVNYFKPKGIPSSSLEEVILTLDEFESIKLADFEEMYQKQAALKMNISRQTFGRIVDSAHKKIADVLIHGKALKIEGGAIKVENPMKFKCRKCNYLFKQPIDPGNPMDCPRCKHVRSVTIHSQENQK